MPDHICAEIQYRNEEGHTVHSDLCVEQDIDAIHNNEWRELLHSSLDEWLDRSQGRGHFHVGDWPDDE